jgi:SAM-dependent methyltransferase
MNVNGSCLLCGHTELPQIRRYRCKTRYGRAVFGDAWLQACDECGLVQVIPRADPEVLADYYERDYRSGSMFGADVADTSRFPKDNLFYLNRGESITELLSAHLQRPNPRVLDIGAGYGHILYALGKRYPDSKRSAIEFSEACVKHLKSLGFQVFSRPVEETLPRLEQEFDGVIISHVLEHLLDPPAVLRLIRRSLAPDGVLYVEVPNIPAESLLKYPDHVWAPRFDEPHITFFSTPTLRKLLESAGFEVLFCDTAGPRYQYISHIRFHLPHPRWFLQDLLPSALFFWLRRQHFTRVMRVQEREEEFYQYGGFRIWLRCVSRKLESSAHDHKSPEIQQFA